MVEIHKTDKFTDTSHRGGRLPINNVCDLLVVHFKTHLANVHSKELDFLLVKFALLWVTEKFRPLQAQERVTDSHDMFDFSLVVVQCVVKIVLQVLVEKQCENFVHASLKTRRHIGEPECHHMHLKWPKRCHKCGLPFVARLDMNLVIS